MSKFVTNDSSINSGGKLDPTDLEILEEAKQGQGIAITSMEQLEKLATDLTATYELYYRLADRCMTKEQADFIRTLRVLKNYSWRAVARAAYECVMLGEWKGWRLWQPPSSQPMGMALCKKAAEFFNENYQFLPWN